MLFDPTEAANQYGRPKITKKTLEDATTSVQMKMVQTNFLDPKSALGHLKFFAMATILLKA